MRLELRLSLRFDYDIHFTHGLFRPGNDLLRAIMGEYPSEAVAFVDEGLLRAGPGLKERIEESGGGKIAVCAIPGGEACKNDPRVCGMIARTLHQRGVDRHGYTIAVGGGAVLDAVGFVSAVLHRGIRHIRVPTTTLAQCDSGVGVKNAVNLFGVKNMVGTFVPPHAVVNDLGFLRSLPFRDWISGTAEAFKVAVIRDSGFLGFLQHVAGRLRRRDDGTMEQVVIRSARIHAGHIAGSGDPFEREAGRPLDFGHWSAHWLETATGHAVRHGEAVAAGVALDLVIARNRGLVGHGEVGRILASMEQCGLSLWDPALERRGGDGRLLVYDGLEEFRRHLGGRLTLAMPDGLGACRHVHELGRSEVEEAVDEMRTRSAGRAYAAAER